MDSVDFADGLLNAAHRVRPTHVVPSLPDGPPLPPSVQLLGFLFLPYPMLEAYRARYGTPFTLRFPGWVNMVIFDDPEAHKEIFTGSSDVLHAGRANETLRPIVGGESLLLLDGERHLRERRLLLPPFHGARMHRYGETMKEIAARDIAGWPLGRVFTLQPRTQSITLDIILRTVFGLDDGAEMDALRDAVSDLITAFSRPGLMVHQVQRPSFPPWAHFLRCRDRVHRLVLRMIAERRRAGGGDDVLSLLLEARHPDGAPMSDGELLDELITLLVAGHETTATALAWAAHHMIEHPTAQHRVQRELDRVFPDGRIEPERISELEYLDALIKETMRLDPVIGSVGRILSAPQRIAGHDLPAGVMVSPSMYLTHRNPAIFPEPERFRPERFLERRVGPYELFAFGGGVRRCIGMAFALYEMKMVLAVLMMGHTLRRAPGTRIRAVRRSVTMAPSGDMPLIVERR